MSDLRQNIDKKKYLVRQLIVLERLFNVIICCGGSLVFIGLFLQAVEPSFQLDVVLSPAQLRNVATRNATFKMLQGARGNRVYVWGFFGCINLIVSYLGMKAIKLIKEALDEK